MVGVNVRQAHRAAMARKAASVGEAYTPVSVADVGGYTSGSTREVAAADGEAVYRRMFSGLEVDVDGLMSLKRIYVGATLERVARGEDLVEALGDAIVSAVLVGRLTAVREGTPAS